MGTPSVEQLSEAVRGFDRLYGLELLSVSDTEVTGRVLVREEIKQMASLATALAVLPRGETAMGLSNATSFLRPITDGFVHARAERLHRGRTTWVWDVTFTDDHDRVCAATRMTIAVRAAPPGPA
jgi:1,4-dihydroxy-2-naphthoyl-CoA hydrolase